MATQLRLVNFQLALRSGRAGHLEFWRDNGDGTCTRLADGLTLTYEKYDRLPGRRQRALRQQHRQLVWDD